MTIYLAHSTALGPLGSRGAGRCCHRGRAANPGTGRAPIAPLFGLAPGGVWPSLRHRRRPDALTVRFHPYPPISGRTVCFCATFRPPQRPRRIGDPLWKPGRYPAPCPEEPGLSSPTAPTYRSPRGGHPAYLALFRNLAHRYGRVNISVPRQPIDWPRRRVIDSPNLLQSTFRRCPSR